MRVDRRYFEQVAEKRYDEIFFFALVSCRKRNSLHALWGG